MNEHEHEHDDCIAQDMCSPRQKESIRFVRVHYRVNSRYTESQRGILTYGAEWCRVIQGCLQGSRGMWEEGGH